MRNDVNVDEGYNAELHRVSLVYLICGPILADWSFLSDNFHHCFPLCSAYILVTY